MTRTDVKLTVLSFVVAGLFACLLVYCGLQVAATHPLVALKLYVAAGALLVITAWTSLMANAERRAERQQQKNDILVAEEVIDRAVHRYRLARRGAQ